MTISGKWSIMKAHDLVPIACCNRDIGRLFTPNYQPPQDLSSPGLVGLGDRDVHLPQAEEDVQICSSFKLKWPSEKKKK